MNDFQIQENSMIDLNEEDLDISPIINCKYIDIDSFKVKKVDKKDFSLLHLNIGSLEKHKDELEVALSLLQFKFDVIGITETKIKSNISPNFDLKINGYKHYQTPTEANKGGVIMYVLDKHDSIPRKDLEKLVYKSRILESTFVEIVVPNKKNIILGCIYRHPSMDLNDFNDEHLSFLLEKLNHKKHSFLLGDFNVDLMKIDEHTNSTEYFDMITSAICSTYYPSNKNNTSYKNTD